MCTSHLLFTVAALAALSLAAPSAAQTYVAGDEFSIAQNPNGVWSYGWKASGEVTGSSLNLYDQTESDSAGLVAWTTGNPDQDAHLVYNPSDAPITLDDIGTFQPREIVQHPGQGGEFSVVRWTAPSAGNVVVSADFRAVDNSGTTVAVVQGGVLLFSGSMNGQVGNTQSYALTTPRSVQAGDTLDFAVGGQWVDGSTASSARVTLTPVPGPGALVTALVGAVPGVFALLRRRNQKA